MADQNGHFMKRLLATFKVEANEHIASIAAGLMELETAGSPELLAEVIETLFRDAHSLKGSARSVNLSEIEKVCQSLENVFAALKRNELEPGRLLLDLLHHAVNLISEMVVPVGSGNFFREEAKIRELVRDLNADAKWRLSEAGPQPEMPAAVSLPAFGREHSASSRTVVSSLTSDSMRISKAKLDAIMLQGEGFLAVKQMIAHQADELREIGAALAALRKDWIRLRPELRALLAAGRPEYGAAAAGGNPYGDKLIEFLASQEEGITGICHTFSDMEKKIDQDRRTVETMVDSLLDHLKTASMLPFSSLLEIVPKLIRDLSRGQGKEVAFTTRGGEIEIDKRILDEMREPLIHLLRNSIDHGIEKPEERVRQKKSPTGTISINVSHWEGKSVEVVVTDDGRGLDADRILEAATKLGILARREAPGLDERKIPQLIFHSGVTTSPIITDLSGRGLGLSIVRERVEKLGGSVSCETTPGQGTTFRLLLPLTLATFRGVLVRVEDYLFLIPTVGLDRTLRVKRQEIKTVENRETVMLEGKTLPFIHLGDVLELVRPAAQANRPELVYTVVLGTGGQRIAFEVDEVLNEQEVLVKDLGPQLARVRNVAGSTVLGSGRLIPILNVSDLMRSAIGLGSAPRTTPPPEPPAERKSILVVEDSVTSRTLLKNILEVSGYKVQTAVDGIEAFTTLKTGEFDLVVSDVEMPRMSGFDLTAKIRADRKLADLPVILVTALESREDRERGIDVGANAYIIKSSFDKSNLLEAIRRLL